MLGRKILVAFILLIQVSCTSIDNNNSVEEFSFVPFDERLYELYSNEKYNESFALLDSLKQVNDSIDFDLSLWRGRLFLITEQYDSAMSVWEEGHKKKYFYLLHPAIEDYKPLIENTWFDSLAEVDKELREKATENAVMKVEVVTPKNYLDSKEYPLLIVLHGGGSSIERSKSHWYSKKMESEYITAYVQNFRHYDYSHFGWRSSDPKEREEFVQLYNKLIDDYSIDTNRVIIGGISAGGSATLDFVLNDIIPAKGFIGICTGKPKEFLPEKIVSLANSTKGFMVSGETDFYLERQQEMVTVFDSINFEYQFHIIDSLGHDYPDDFPVWIDSALSYIDG